MAQVDTDTLLDRYQRTIEAMSDEQNDLRREVMDLRGAVRQAAADCEQLSDAWFGSGRGQLRGVAARLRAALKPKATADA